MRSCAGDAGAAHGAGTTTRAPTATRCSARHSPAGRCTSCARRCPNRPGVVAEIALALGAPASTSSTWRSRRRRTTARGWSRCGSAARSDAERARAADRRARIPGGQAPMNVRFDPARGAVRAAAPAARQVDLPSRRAARGDGLRAGAHRELPATPPTPTRRSRPSARSARSSRRAARRSSCAAPACARRARPSEPIDVGNAGTLLRLLPGWLAAQDGPLVHARRRRVDPPPARRPDRRAAALMGARARGARRALRAADGPRRAPARDLLRAGGGQRPGQVVRAARRARRRRRRRRSASPPAAATTPSGCCWRAGVAIRRDGRHVTRGQRRRARARAASGSRAI